MIRFENTIEIARPPGDVYAYLVDLEHTPEWNWAVTSSQKITPGPIGIGTRYRQSRSVPRPAVEVIEVVGLEQGKRVEVAGTLGPFRAHLTYEMEPSPNGTLLTNVVQLEAPIPLGSLGDVLGGRVRASVAENLGVLKRLLEGEA